MEAAGHKPVDPILVEVIGNRLQTVCREMLVSLIRAAFSTNIKERYDCGTGVFDIDGDQVALAAYPPLHMGGMRGIVRLLRAEYPPEEIRPGDMFITNDPYVGVSTHLPDPVLVAPVFFSDRLAGFVASVAHHADIGGRVPGGQAPDSRSIFEEGFRIPLVRLFADHKPVPDIHKILRTNVRNPDEREMDLRAQFAANFVGIRGYQEVCQRYGDEVVNGAGRAWVDYSEARLRDKLRQLPDIVCSHEERVENDLDDKPVTFRVTVQSKDGLLHADFEGTSRAFEGAKNIPLSATVATVWMVVKSMLDPQIPASEGAFRPLRVVAPPGTIVNPVPPSAVGERALSCQVLADVVMGAMSKLVPERALAECGPHHGINISGINPRTGRFFANHESFAGGMGARRTKDGVSACRVHIAGSANLPVEPLEAELPILIRRYDLRRDSGGPGRFRGGLGLRRDIEVRADEVRVTLRSERQMIPAFGIGGGAAGATGEFILNPDTDRETRLPIFVSNRRFARGDVISVRTPGGGGYGNPRERPRELVAQDVRSGYVSPAAARDIYGA
ncbi:MAG: hydantoinase B/oxoprolinase family protein [Proteobacteria bacterium]|nr:hydantoinase B/oxoprolinase family protein [Pseudomonadota bacterium]